MSRGIHNFGLKLFARVSEVNNSWTKISLFDQHFELKIIDGGGGFTLPPVVTSLVACNLIMVEVSTK